MKDDFFAQIQATEAKAKKLVEEKKRTLEEELISYEKSLKEDGHLALEKEREKAHEALAKKQVEARELYEERVADGKKEITQLEKGAEEKVSKIFPALEAYFLNELLG